MIVLVLIAVVYIGSYIVMRRHHSNTGQYPTSTSPWIQINYDEHYVWADFLHATHQPLVSIDRYVTGAEVGTWKNDFHGDPNHYEREYFN